ncbi:pallilysin-related adhesin [Treponema sp.]|uniref:pallilysin-related adhesin n=1 Tax=Treponema sp. TaxID=166 RepID=UPI00388CFD7E
MKKKITLALLILATAAVLAVVIAKRYIYKEEETIVSSSVVIPKSNAESQTSVQNVSIEDDDSAMVSLIPLHSNETLLSIVSMDFDGDGLDDQVNAVRTMDSPYIALIVGMYNQDTSTYERKAELTTEIIQVQTFSYTGIDLSGDHRNALVYQGFAENGDSILKAYHVFYSSATGYFRLSKIADLRGDGTIFIQQMDRYDAYERSKANGTSFPIWVYTTDTENEKSTDQLQVQYEWNNDEKKYVKTKTLRVAGSRIAAKELAKIQDGTVGTFANFLEGLWYVNESDGSGVRYIFFNYASKEIIFFKDDKEEVYIWAHSNIRRNGMYLSTINQEIENLKRRVDISLKSTEEIHIRIQDDVRMRISESTEWDGDYKKTNQNLYKTKLKSKKVSNEIALELEKIKSWKTSEGYVVKFTGGKYSVSGDGVSDEGSYSWNGTREDNMVQFRSQKNDGAFFTGVYKVTVEENQDKGKTYSMQPFKIYADGMVAIDQRAVVLTAIAEKE